MFGEGVRPTLSLASGDRGFCLELALEDREEARERVPGDALCMKLSSPSQSDVYVLDVRDRSRTKVRIGDEARRLFPE